jgi:hypothetical protein
MSILSDFIAAVAPIAQTVIGTETLAINGGTAIAGTYNEARNSRTTRRADLSVTG